MIVLLLQPFGNLWATSVVVIYRSPIVFDVPKCNLTTGQYSCCMLSAVCSCGHCTWLSLRCCRRSPGTIVLRICVFPLVIFAQRNMANMNNHMPTMTRLQTQFTASRQSGNPMEGTYPRPLLPSDHLCTISNLLHRMYSPHPAMSIHHTEALLRRCTAV